MKMTARTRTVAYIRVSTEQQADFGVSLEVQEAKLRQYADLFDLEVVCIEADAGLSASSLDRPGLQRALSALREGRATALLVVKLDRLTRSIRDLTELLDDYFKDGKYALLSMGEQVDTRSASGRLVLNILTVISQWEREATSERTTAVMQHLKATGKFTGGWPPYGWTLEGGELVPVPEEQAVIAAAKTMRAQGESLRTIAKKLPKARGGKTFAPTQVARMVDDSRALEAS